MKKDSRKNDRLGVRFHQTFMPERHYISALLRYCSEDGTGSDAEISEKTGIPTGKSSGKVPSTIKYCIGMDLIEAQGKGKSRTLRPTEFGNAVMAKDPHLGKSLTQWMAHLHMCRRMGGVETWFLLFGRGKTVLGDEFTRERLEDYLAGIFGRAKRSLIGPMLRTYEDQAALKATGALVFKNKTICREAAPLTVDFRFGHAAFLLGLWERHIPEQRQTTLSDFEEETLWGRILGWNESLLEEALQIVGETGAIEIDKQMRPWVLIKKGDSNALWSKLYD